MIEKTTNNRASGGGCSRFTLLELESLVSVDMKKMSQSENLAIPNINTDHPSTVSTTTTPPRRIYAFSNRGGPRRLISASLDDVVDPQLKENKSILNFLENLAAQSEVKDYNPRRDAAVAENDGGVQKRKRKRKSKAAKENGEEFEGLGVINVNGEEIDLKFLAVVADGAFEGELNKMTEGMVREDEFLGFLNGLEGRWGSSRRRRKYVDAADFVKALPTDWKILLSLRPRARQPSLYCRRYVSPSDVHFKSCKEVALHLKSQFVTNAANPPKEGAMAEIESDCQVNTKSVAHVPRSSPPASQADLLRSKEMCNIRRLDLDTLTENRANPDDAIPIGEPKNMPPVTSQMDTPPPIIKNSLKQRQVVVKKEVDPLEDTVTSRNEPNGEGSSSSLLKLLNEAKNDSEVKRHLKTTCIWCLDDFFRDPVDFYTLASSSGFICPKCKDEIQGRLETTLSRLYQDGNK